MGSYFKAFALELMEERHVDVVPCPDAPDDYAAFPPARVVIWVDRARSSFFVKSSGLPCRVCWCRLLCFEGLCDGESATEAGSCYEAYHSLESFGIRGCEVWSFEPERGLNASGYVEHFFQKIWV